MGRELVTFTLNGAARKAESGGGESLLRYLRGVACLKGAKNGCGTGHCGACTVLVDGEARKSCVTPMRSLEGKSVVTIEGIGSGAEPHPLQRAFLLSGAIQCGFCTPGMILAAKALLDRNPDPDDAAIKEALKGNYCRCTGYVKIIAAVKLAAAMLRGEAAPDAAASAGGLGVSVPDLEGLDKARGSLAFADDLEMPGMLRGKILWSAHPRARIRGIDASKAEAAPGVVRVLSAKDLPGRGGFGMIKPDQPILCGEEVRFTGDMVALVVAETEEAAAIAVKLIEVEYEPLPGVFGPMEALAENAPRLYPEGNVCKHLVHVVGDPERARRESEVLVSGRFETPAVEHGYLEPEAGLAYMEADGSLVLKVPTQSPFETRRQLAEILGLPEERIRVVCTPLGGGFGSKADGTIEFLLAVGAFLLGRPLKITLTREESLRVSTKRHPFILEYEVGASREGRLSFVDARLYADAGPYTTLSPRVIDQACIFSCGPYVVPNARIEGWALFTDNCDGGAFRGFGINQAAVAMESLLDELALRLGMDPFELRLANALDVGDRTVSGEILRSSVGIKATLRGAREAAARFRARYANAYPEGSRRLGVGVASAFKNVGAGKGKVDDAGAILELLPEGAIRLRVSAVDMGQGIRTTLAQIAAEVLGAGGRGIDPGLLELVTGDTSLTPPHGNAVGERQTLISGNAVVLAGRDFLASLRGAAGALLGLEPSSIVLEGDGIAAGGARLCGLAELSRRLAGAGPLPRAERRYVAPRTFALYDTEGRGSVSEEEYRNYPAYAYATQVAFVEFDESTGRVRLLGAVACHDVGRSINPSKIEGQVEGSCSMGQGYALSESYPMERGVPAARSYGRLGIPSILDTPEYEILVVEDPVPDGPFGAKGISEVATVPMTPAILNAIRDASGLRVRTLPATPARLLALMAEGKDRSASHNVP